jgi:hypothetical protein
LEDAHLTVFEMLLSRTASIGLIDVRFRNLYGTVPGLVHGTRAVNIHGIDERVNL